MTSKKKKTKSLRKRNPITLNPLMRKAHVHNISKKTERQQVKQKLKNQLDDEV